MKKFIIIIIVLLIAGGAYGVYLFTKKTPSLDHQKPDFQITANELFDAFEQNEATAMTKFENKIIEVTGKVLTIQKTDSLSNIILIADNAMIGGVNCSFNKPDFQADKDETVTIKGRCQGYLSDVVLNNCVQIKK